MRILFKIVILVVIIAIAGLITLPFVIDPNDYKQEIADQVEKATGRKLILGGDIGLSVFPWVALELGSLSLSNAEGFKADSFAKVDAAEVRIKLMPLLKKQLEMDTIVLDGLVLNLEKNKAGKTNWDDLAGDDKSTEPGEKPDPKSSEPSTPALTDISVAGVKLTNANILWSDATTGESYKLENLNLNIDPVIPGKPTAIDINFNLVSIKPSATVHIDLNSKATVDLEDQQYALTGLNLTAQAEGAELPFSIADIVLKGDITADMQQQTMTLSALVVKIHDLSLNGDIRASKLLSDNPNFAGHIDIEPFSLRKLADRLAIELPPMNDAGTLELVQVNTDFTGSTKHLKAEKLDVILDQSKLSGQLAVNDFNNPAVNFKLVVDEIDVDRYLPPFREEETQAASTPAAAAAGTSQLPLDMLRQINVKGTLDVGKLKVSGAHSKKNHLTINAANGLIKMYPISADLYQGQYKGNVTLDARGNALKLSIDENLKDAQVGPLLKDIIGDDKISGTANAKVKLRGAGATVDQITQTLAGSGQFSFTDGAVKGVNIALSIRKAKAALKGETLPESDAPLKTDFSSLTGSFTAAQGIISNQDLLVKSPLLRINGAGKIDLAKEGIDYGLKVSVVGTSKGQEGKDLEKLKGLTIPVKITGSFDNPKPTVDLAELVKEQATQEVKDKAADKLKEKLGDDLGGLLGGALGAKESKPAPDSEEAVDSASEPKEQVSPEKQLEDKLKGKLKGLF